MTKLGYDERQWKYVSDDRGSYRRENAWNNTCDHTENKTLKWIIGMQDIAVATSKSKKKNHEQYMLFPC